MSEALGTKTNSPTQGLLRPSETWSPGGAGLPVPGNALTPRRARGGAGSVAIEDERDLELVRRWAKAASAESTQTWVQINHPGRQSPRAATKEPVAPSAVPLEGMAPGVFAKPRALEEKEIEQ